VHEQTVAFLREQGRMKYLRPLYKALAASGALGATLAQVMGCLGSVTAVTLSHGAAPQLQAIYLHHLLSKNNSIMQKKP
jgi:Leukotriene A4 hydrolase, C-terminal